MERGPLHGQISNVNCNKQVQQSMQRGTLQGQISYAKYVKNVPPKAAQRRGMHAKWNLSGAD